jgi:hypothetical protein
MLVVCNQSPAFIRSGSIAVIKVLIETSACGNAVSNVLSLAAAKALGVILCCLCLLTDSWPLCRDVFILNMNRLSSS